MIDHAGFGVTDYARSKAFYERALAPLGIRLIMEPMGRAAGRGRLPQAGLAIVRRREVRGDPVLRAFLVALDGPRTRW